MTELVNAKTEILKHIQGSNLRKNFVAKERKLLTKQAIQVASLGRGCRGRGRGGRGRCSRGIGQVSAGQGSDSEDGSQPTPNEGYDVQDSQNVIPPFTPKRPPGIHFVRAVLLGAMTTELEFFRLFLTPEIISDIATHSNKYLQMKLADRKYSRTSPEEIEKLIALLI